MLPDPLLIDLAARPPHSASDLVARAREAVRACNAAGSGGLITNHHTDWGPGGTQGAGYRAQQVRGTRFGWCVLTPALIQKLKARADNVEGRMACPQKKGEGRARRVQMARHHVREGRKCNPVYSVGLKGRCLQREHWALQSCAGWML